GRAGSGPPGQTKGRPSIQLNCRPFVSPEPVTGPCQGFHPFPSSIVYSVFPSSIVNPPGMLYRFVGGPLPSLLPLSSVAEYLPIGIQPILNDPSGWIRMSNFSPFSWNTESVTVSLSGKVTGFPSCVSRPVNASTVGPSNDFFGPHPAT